jgi:hypothetical protein
MSACHAVTLDQLLGLRDGEPITSDVVTHVEQCAVCAHELTRLRNLQVALRAMPSLTPPAYDVSAIKNRATRKAHVRRWTGFATAASVSAITLLVVLSNLRHNTAATPIVVDSPTPAVPVESPEPAIEPLVVRSEQLESLMRQLPRRPHVQRAGTATTINALQNQIQWVDYQLSLAGDVGMNEHQSVQLWQDRVELMDTLVKVRYAEAQRFLISN